MSLIRINLDKECEEDYVYHGTLWLSRDDKKFVHINLSAIEGMILMSELYFQLNPTKEKDKSKKKGKTGPK